MPLKSNLFHHRQGLGLIELVIYIALASWVLVGIVTFSWRVMGVGATADASAELTQNGRFALTRISQAIRSADGLNQGASMLGVHPGVLTLDVPGTTDVVIDTYTKNLILGGQPVTIRKLRMKNSSGVTADLTSDAVDFTNFTVSELQRESEAMNFQIALTLRPVRGAQDPLLNRTLVLTTSASIRR